MILISEEINPEVEYLVEGSGKDKKYFIEGIYIQTEKQNRNGRIYSKKTMEQALTEYNKDFIQNNRALGELNHPASSTVNLDKVSHIIENLDWNGNNVVGKARLLTNQPMGRIAADLIDEGIKLAVSTRGISTKINKRSGISFVNENYRLNAVDVVHDPSGQDCFVNGIFENYKHSIILGNSSEINNNKDKFIEFIKTLRKK